MADPSVVKFFSLDQFVVVGASTDITKFGNKVLRCYQVHDYTVIPINKKESTIEGLACKASLKEVPNAEKTGVSIVTPPAVTKQVIEEGISLGFRHFFFQPGTVDVNVRQTIEQAKEKYKKDIQFIESCVLIELGCH